MTPDLKEIEADYGAPIAGLCLMCIAEGITLATRSIMEGAALAARAMVAGEQLSTEAMARGAKKEGLE